MRRRPDAPLRRSVRPAVLRDTPALGSVSNRMGDATDDLADLWRWFADTQFRSESPIYERIANAVADDRELLDILRGAPPAAHLPLAALAAVRYLLLDGLDHPLGDVYCGRSSADPGPLFLDSAGGIGRRCSLCSTDGCRPTIAGAAPLIGPALTWAARQRPGPYGLIDVGATGSTWCSIAPTGLRPAPATGPIDSSVRVPCEVLGGDPPIADRLPHLDQRVGIDLAPVDLSTHATPGGWWPACGPTAAVRSGRGVDPPGPAGPPDAARRAGQRRAAVGPSRPPGSRRPRSS